MSAPDAESRVCELCGAPLVHHLEQGLCTRCLARFTLQEEPPGAQEPQEAPEHSETGTRFGDYELLEEIAHGGMGVVYRARQLSLNRIVAVKMILCGQFAGKSAFERFRAEAETAALLQHPNIVAIHTIGETRGQPYYSMDYVAGRSLADIVQTGPLPGRTAARYVRKVALAVQYAHTHGVLHRDLKPANVLIDENDEPRITDFGIARRLSGDSELTLTGQVLGSPNFMPPEQGAGKKAKLGPGADVYGLGALLYYLVTARPPFLAETFEATLAQVLNNEPVGPRHLNPNLALDLETICLKCLEKDPARRYASAQDLADELDRFLNKEPIRARPITRRRRIMRWAQRNPVAAVLSAVVVCLGFAILIGTPWALVRINAERNRALQRANDASIERSRAEDNLRHQQVAHIEMLFQTDHAEDAVALLGEICHQTPDDGRFASWIVNELTHRNFALPLVGPLVHTGRVCLVAFSPDGRLLLTATRQHTVQVWDAKSGSPLGAMLKHSANPLKSQPFLGGFHGISAEFSPDSRWVVTGSVDKTAVIWDADTGRPRAAPLTHPDWVTFVRFSPDGKILATACKDGMARLWNPATGELIGEGFRHEKWVNTVVFSPDGKRVLTASDDKTARVWDVASQKPITPPLAHNHWVRVAAFSPDSTSVATASSDATARIWDAVTGAPQTGPLLHGGQLNVLQFSPDGRFLATGGYDRLVRIWKVKSGQLQCAPMQHQSTVRSLDFSPEGLRIVSSSEDRTARVWEVGTGKALTERIRHDDAVWSVCFSPDGRSVATGSSDRTALVWDVRPGKALPLRLKTFARTSDVHWVDDSQSVLTVTRSVYLHDANSGEMICPRRLAETAVVSASAVARGGRIFLACESGEAAMWDSGVARFITPPVWLPSPASAVALSPDETLGVTSSRDGSVRVWALANAREVGQLTHPGLAHVMAFSPTGDLVATASDDLAVRLWQIPAGRQISDPLLHPDWIHDLAFSPDGQVLVTASQDATARVWTLRTGQLCYAPLHHRGAVLQLAFSRDGRLLATASRDGTVRVWLAATGQVCSEPLTLGSPILDVDFSPDGKWLAACGEDGRIGLWEVSASQPVMSRTGHSAKVNVCRFSPTGDRLLTGGSDHYACIWELLNGYGPPPGWLPDLVKAVAGSGIAPAEKSGRAYQLSDRQLRARLLPSTAEDRWTRWAHWFLADRAGRTASPQATNTVACELARRLDLSVGPTPAMCRELIESLWIQPDDGDLNSQVAIVLALSILDDDPERVASVDWLSRRGLQMNAAKFRGLWARSAYFALAGHMDQAFALLDQAMVAGSDDLYFWLWSAGLLESAGQFERGAQALAKAREVCSSPRFASRRDQVRQMHAEYLKRHSLSR